MYLTRFRVNTARRGARSLLASPHKMHAAVRAAFPTPEEYENPSGRTLWRLDSPAPATVHLYITSPGRPDLTHLVEQAGWPTIDTWDVRDYRGLLGSLAAGQQWAFRLTANPTRNGRKSPESPETQRFGRLREAEQIEWLTSRAERHGFTVRDQRDGGPNLRVHRRETVAFQRAQRTVTLVTATYDGVLEIRDAAAFRRTLTGGLGHAKAYGCGLLTLAPAR